MEEGIAYTDWNLNTGASTRPSMMSRIWTLHHLLRRTYWRLVGPTTLGSRCLVLRGNELLLVRHTYEPWWYLPGGGVKRGETFVEAARREVWEETAIHVSSLRLFGIYHNRLEGKNDHVALFAARCSPSDAPISTSREIDAASFFPIDRLPEGVSPATRRRVQESLDGMPADEW
jgi:8-oxo-dGTP pyrophosphatase MutT (NUDIX family)